MTIKPALFKATLSEKERRIQIALGFGYMFRIEIFYETPIRRLRKLIHKADVTDTHPCTALLLMWNKLTPCTIPRKATLYANVEIIAGRNEDVLHRTIHYTHCGGADTKLYHRSGIDPWEIDYADSSLLQVD